MPRVNISSSLRFAGWLRSNLFLFEIVSFPDQVRGRAVPPFVNSQARNDGIVKIKSPVKQGLTGLNF